MNTRTEISLSQLERLRSWFPIPTRKGGLNLSRWVLLEANRYAVTAVLLSLTFVAILITGSIWTFQMYDLLTETQAVQTVLSTFLGGIILLVSIVVSINAIVLSHEILSVEAQKERIEGNVEFRQEMSLLSGTDVDPTDLSTFLRVMSEIIRERATALADVSEEIDREIAADVETYAELLAETAEDIENSLDRVRGGEYRALWIGLETDYGSLMNRTHEFMSAHRDHIPEKEEEQFNDLIHSLKIFATGREYFKTLYYNREISELSRTLLAISLPSIIVTAWATLAISANMLPEFWLFGLPPLLTFVAFIFTIALSPFIVLTAYMLRVATITRRTAGTGLFVLQS